MRLNKFLSKAGIASRRGADQLLEQGRIAVNDKIVTRLGTVIDETRDKVSIDGESVSIPETRTYLILNKPVEYLVTRKDDFHRRTVMELIGNYRNSVKPVGRLDYDSSGLLIFTDDGELAFRLSHPKFEIEKKYLVKCEGLLSDDDIRKLSEGIELDEGRTSPAKIEVISRGRDFCRFYITIHEGRKRQIRRMCRAVGKKVVTLKRVSIGKIDLGELKSGRYRLLNHEEIAYLKKTVGL